MLGKTRPAAVILGALAALAVGSGCDGCGRRAPTREKETAPVQALRSGACTTDAECEDRDPCTRNECVDERCAVALVPRGTSCDNDTVCDGVATCDANGRCAEGAPPALDDGNPCTIDACDPKRGVTHESIPVDDFDACTSDSCDRSTGSIAHASLAIDDGNDCTADSCDPRTGVKHVQPDAVYTCEASCDHGFHVASRTPSPECGSDDALRSFCAPNCGASFYTCETSCPRGYTKRATSPGGNCGTKPSIMVFCAKG
jgi:hypothetical protein